MSKKMVLFSELTAEQLVPYAFSIVMASATGTVHALKNTIFIDCFTI